MGKLLILHLLLAAAVASVLGGHSHGSGEVPLQEECLMMMENLKGKSDPEKIETVVQLGAKSVFHGKGDGGVRNLLILGAVLRGDGSEEVCKLLEVQKGDELIITQLASITPAIDDSSGKEVKLAINLANAVLEVRLMDGKTRGIPLLNQQKARVEMIETNSNRKCVKYQGNKWCDVESPSRSFHNINEFRGELEKAIERFEHKFGVYSLCKLNPRGKPQERYFYYEAYQRRLYYSSYKSTFGSSFDGSQKYIDLSGVSADMITIDTEHIDACTSQSLCMRINDGSRVWPLCMSDPYGASHATLTVLKKQFTTASEVVENQYLRSGSIELVRWALAQLMSVTAKHTSQAGPLVQQYQAASESDNAETSDNVNGIRLMKLNAGHPVLIAGVMKAIKTIKSGFTSEMEEHFGRSLKHLLGDIAAGHTADLYGLTSDSELMCTLDTKLDTGLFDMKGMSVCPRADNRDASVPTEQQWVYPVQFSLDHEVEYNHNVMTKAYMFIPKHEQDGSFSLPQDEKPDRGLLLDRAGLLRSNGLRSLDIDPTDTEESSIAPEEDNLDGAASPPSTNHHLLEEEDDGQSHVVDGNSAGWPGSEGEPKWRIVDSNAFTVGTSWRGVKEQTPFKFWLVNAYKTDIGGHVILRHGNIDRAKWSSDETEPDEWSLRHRKYDQFKAWILHLAEQGEITRSSGNRYRVRSLSTVANNMVVKGDMKMWKQQNDFFRNHNKFDSNFDVIHFNLAANMFSTISMNDIMSSFTKESRVYLRWVIEDTYQILDTSAKRDFLNLVDALEGSLMARARRVKEYLQALADRGNVHVVRVLKAATLFIRLQDGKSSRLYEILSLALLDNALGVVSAINCRSGLDRTGWVFSAHVAVAQVVDVLGRDNPQTWIVLEDLFDSNSKHSYVRVASDLDSDNDIRQYKRKIAQNCNASQFFPHCIVSRLQTSFFLNLLNVGYKVTNLSTGIPGFKWLQKGFGTILHHHALFPTYVYSGEDTIRVKADKESSGYGHLVQDDFMSYLLGGCYFRGA